MSIFLKRLAASAAFLALAATSLPSQAQKVYNIASFGDYTGPFANVYPPADSLRRAVVDRWNKEEGAKLGIEVRMKTYDTHYDPATVSTLWPAAKAELNPVLILGLGAADVVALMTRLPDDKIPMLSGNAGYGFAMKPDLWSFLARPTYGHEVGAFMDWMSAKLNRPVKFAAVSTETNPGFADMSKGIIAYAKSNPTKAQLTETIYTETAPVDLTLQVRRAVNANVDVIVATGTTGQVVAVKRALQALGKKVPVVVSMHNSLGVIAGLLGGAHGVEGDYEVYAAAIASDGRSPPRDFFDMLRKEYGAKADWTGTSIVFTGQVLWALRAIEHAAKKVGPNNVTGAAVREALLAGPITSAEMYGFLPDLAYSTEFPIPVNSTVHIGSVVGGKFVQAASNIPVPKIAKWW